MTVNLTEGFMGRLDDGVRLTVVKLGGEASRQQMERVELQNGTMQGWGGGALGVLYIGWGSEVRGQGGRAATVIQFSLPLVSKPITKGGGDGKAPIYEGKGGGTCGGLAQLHLSARE
jgi:hypothetical protein